MKETGNNKHLTMIFCGCEVLTLCTCEQIGTYSYVLYSNVSAEMESALLRKTL
jgi:hypothetical protein